MIRPNGPPFLRNVNIPHLTDRRPNYSEYAGSGSMGYNTSDDIDNIGPLTSNHTNSTSKRRYKNYSTSSNEFQLIRPKKNHFVNKNEEIYNDIRWDDPPVPIKFCNVSKQRFVRSTRSSLATSTISSSEDDSDDETFKVYSTPKSTNKSYDSSGSQMSMYDLRSSYPKRPLTEHELCLARNNASNSWYHSLDSDSHNWKSILPCISSSRTSDDGEPSSKSQKSKGKKNKSKSKKSKDEEYTSGSEFSSEEQTTPRGNYSKEQSSSKGKNSKEEQISSKSKKSKEEQSDSKSKKSKDQSDNRTETSLSSIGTKTNTFTFPKYKLKGSDCDPSESQKTSSRFQLANPAKMRGRVQENYVSGDKMWYDGEEERRRMQYRKTNDLSIMSGADHPSLRVDDIRSQEYTISARSFNQLNFNENEMELTKHEPTDPVKEEELQEYIHLQFQLPDGTRSRFIMRKNVAVRTAITSFCARTGVVSKSSLIFSNAAGQELNRSVTPEMMDMNHGDVIFVSVR